jgi:hypothetical protein
MAVLFAVGLSPCQCSCSATVLQMHSAFQYLRIEAAKLIICACILVAVLQNAPVVCCLSAAWWLGVGALRMQVVAWTVIAGVCAHHLQRVYIAGV